MEVGGRGGGGDLAGAAGMREAGYVGWWRWKHQSALPAAATAAMRNCCGQPLSRPQNPVITSTHPSPTGVYRHHRLGVHLPASPPGWGACGRIRALPHREHR